MKTIRLIDEAGSDLSSRWRASGLRRQVLTVVAGGEVCAVDFDGVRAVSDSFADELFGVLAEERGDEWFREHVRLVNLTPELRQSILEALAVRLLRSPAEPA